MRSFDSNKGLKDEMNRLRQLLNTIMENGQENDDRVLELSEKLDVLILEYYKNSSSIAV